jgi:hypothetical protein
MFLVKLDFNLHSYITYDCALRQSPPVHALLTVHALLLTYKVVRSRTCKDALAYVQMGEGFKVSFLTCIRVTLFSCQIKRYLLRSLSHCSNQHCHHRGSIAVLFIIHYLLNMGISGQNYCSWQTGKLPFEIVIFLLEKIASHVRDRDVRDAEEVPQQQLPPQCLKVGMDANFLGFKYANTRKLLEPDGAIWNMIAKAFSEKLIIDVIIICDHPTKRHSLKRASCERR